MSSNDSPPRACCRRCRLQPEVCVCAEAPRLDISTRLVVVIHAKEWRRSTNTGYLARLATKAGEVRLHGRPHQPVSSQGIDSASPATLVLYPGRGAQPLSPEYIARLARPLTLLVPDGNWNQARNMMRRVPILRDARPVCLESSILRHTGLRRNLCSNRMSTFEAIAQALGVFEGQATEDHLLAFFRQVLSRMVKSQRHGLTKHSPS